MIAKQATNAECQRFRIRQEPESLIAKLQAVIYEYSEREGTEFDCAMRDALTDLRHICDAYDLSFGKIDREAHRGYLEELVTEGDEA